MNAEQPRTAILRLLSACALALSLAACDGDKANGTVCASCGDEDESSCGTWEIPSEQLMHFCGDANIDQCNVCHRDVDDEDDDGSTGEFICSVPLVCVQPQDSAARRCYPKDPATQKAYTNFECAGVPPDV
jgi:hypothetical protein